MLMSLVGRFGVQGNVFFLGGALHPCTTGWMCATERSKKNRIAPLFDQDVSELGGNRPSFIVYIMW
jgi:hypothetical protein